MLMKFWNFEADQKNFINDPKISDNIAGNAAYYRKNTVITKELTHFWKNEGKCIFRDKTIYFVNLQFILYKFLGKDVK